LKHACFRAAAALVLTLITGCITPAHRPPNPNAEATQCVRTATGLEKKNPAKVIGLYLYAAEKTFAITSDKTASPSTREQALAIYNTAVANSTVVMQRQARRVLPGSPQAFSAAGKNYVVRIAPAKRERRVDPGAFDRLIATTEISKKHLKHGVRRDGLGGQLIGVFKADGIRENCPPEGFAEPLTAIAEFGQPDHNGKTPVIFFFYNPQNTGQVTVGSMPLCQRCDS